MATTTYDDFFLNAELGRFDDVAVVVTIRSRPQAAEFVRSGYTAIGDWFKTEDVLASMKQIVDNAVMTGGVPPYYTGTGRTFFITAPGALEDPEVHLYRIAEIEDYYNDMRIDGYDS